MGLELGEERHSLQSEAVGDRNSLQKEQIAKP